MGLVALANASGLAIERTNAGDIGFTLGPRLNAAGRLESALKAFDLLMTDDLMQAGLLAQELCDQNRKRQDLTKEMQLAAEGSPDIGECEQLIFAVSPEFTFDQVGLVGLVAARLTETYYRPSIVGVAKESEGYVRCSCRSIPEFHITRALDECADLMVRHGGHAMAAGLTVRNENLPELRLRLYEIARRELGGKVLSPVARADLSLPLSDLKRDVYDLAAALQPTGAENPEAVFISQNLTVRSSRIVGQDGRHLKLVVSDGRITYDAIAFRQGHWYGRLPERVDLLFNFEINSYNGRESFQLNVRDIKDSREKY
jgi:single-stranded-DNA-specific exonuclease